MAGWEDNSSHAINFYYLDRQTDGSNLMLQISISNLSPARFGAPRILKAETIQDKTLIYVNNKLDPESINKFVNNNEEFPILVNKQGEPNLFAYRLESISGPESAGSEGFIYTITGKVCEDRNCEKKNIYLVLEIRCLSI